MGASCGRAALTASVASRSKSSRRRIFKGPRPGLTIAPGTEQIVYGGLATCTSAHALTIDRVVLMRPGHVSHGYNAEQKHIECRFLAFPDGTLQVVMPNNPNLAPAGWYRLFALQAGVPSVAQ